MIDVDMYICQLSVGRLCRFITHVSIRLANAGFVSKYLYISSNVLYLLVDPSF